MEFQVLSTQRQVRVRSSANLGARASHVLVVMYLIWHYYNHLEETQFLKACSDTAFIPVVLI